MPQAPQSVYKNILVVDDSEIDQLIVRKVIQITSFAQNVVIKNSGQTALEYLAVTPPDKLPEIIFLDLNMPVLDGLSFLKIFETLPEIIRKTCQIVVLSSSTNKNDLTKVLESQYVKKVITKPLTIEMAQEWALPEE
jgi:CheY-like chemotaxis protein